MKPREANFDGAKGLRFRNGQGKDCTFSLRRGKVTPAPSARFENELIWWYPEGEDPQLLYVDANSKFYELDFHPLEQPPWGTND